MRYMRVSDYKADRTHSTMVTSEADLREDIHVACHKMREYARSFQVDQDVEIFEHGDDFVSATLEAEKRAQQRLDRTRGNVAVLRDHTISCLRMVKRGGVVGTKYRSPLPREAILEAFQEVARHPFYESQVLETQDENGEQVIFQSKNEVGTQ